MPAAVVIMAGGSGERFWPYSRKEKPKQFLEIAGKGSLLQQTVRRALLLTSIENIYIVTGKEYIELVREQVPELLPDNLLIEPAGRDTAPCIALAAAYLAAKNTETLMVVLPADHMVLDNDAFCATIREGLKVAASTGGLVTVGIQPTRPETGYGYIHVGVKKNEAGRAYPVDRFVEKPDARQAAAYLASGEYLWNSGMFIWQVKAIREAIRRHLPELAAGMAPIEAAVGTEDFECVLRDHFPALPKISIDYGVIEKADNVWVVPGSFGWDDLGTWTALERVMEPDSRGNLIQGQAVLLDTENVIARNDNGEKLMVAFGLKDLLIVDMPDVLLVAHKDRVPELKKVIQELQKQGLGRFLHSLLEEGDRVSGLLAGLDWKCPVVDKPWGREILWTHTTSYAGKILQVQPGHSLSRQYHREKRETMWFLKGEGELELGARKIQVRPNMIFDIPPGTVHRIRAKTGMVVLEVSSPHLDDVIRLEDAYGRADLRAENY
ncbi:mannose-1-phosphate guanylyltransferase [Neomoorella thermoacetica]|uniref:mannose-1-phosphate guanylyltransferase n=1 Tax=Neomoorella thermoacetica TaxID=1525 RepID=UPI00091E1CF8|nr:mannose-1-phosphate guanylyltransferase [Moorella thermoacetica]OIQ52786.1 alginate biosynthesis protein AlgA [Moorella thermoacetica]